MKKPFPILIGILIASVSSLAFEITLIRTFSISLWYHFAFMVISIAMLGLGASGTLLSVFPGLRDYARIPSYFLLLSVSIPASYLLANAIPLEPARFSWDRIQLFYISLYYLLLAFPFFAFGLVIATAFATMRDYTRYIYATDLTGAGIGSLLVLWLLSVSNPGSIVFILSSLVLVSAFICGQKRIKAASLLFFCILQLVLFYHPSYIDPNISPYKPLEMALRFPGAEHLKTYNSPFSRVDLLKSPAVRYAPGLSFKYLESLPAQTGISVDAGTIYAITHIDKASDLAFIEYLPSSLPYELSRVHDVLVLEPKGGLSVITADYYKAQTVHKIDSNPVVIKAVRNYLKGFSSDIYGRDTDTGLGRSWLTSTDRKYDLIDLSLMGSLPSGSFGFSEDYRFTVEAFNEYLRHLSPDGLLSLTLFIIPPPRTEFRLLNALASSFEQQGMSGYGKHLAAIRSWGTITIIAKKSELSREDISAIKRFTQDKRFDLVYYPGISEEESNRYVKMPSNEYFEAFQRLTDPAERVEFNREYLFDINAVYDENPFFHYYLKIRNIRDIYELMGEKWQYFVEEGYLLPVIFLQVVILSSFLILLPGIRIKQGTQVTLSFLQTLSYFAFLGIGFMFIEISFIQKMILPLEHPSYAAAVVLSSMLISSGLGSLFSQRFRFLRKKRTILVLSLILFLYSLFLPSLMNSLYAYTLKEKIVSVFFILLPAGCLMGIPFPLGLTLLGRHRPDMIPWAWAVNGCFSVLAPLLAIMFALSVGFKMVIITGVLMYLMAYVTLLSKSYAQE
jgi:hypothetical protein